MKQTHKKSLIFALFLIWSLHVFTPTCLASTEALHPAYLTGFSDGSIRPEDALTREQLAQALYRLLPESVRLETRAPCCFSDVAPDRWSYPAIQVLSDLGILYGTTDGRFLPEEGVSGETLAAVLMRIAASEDGQDAFPELAAGWRAEEIRFDAGNGWVMGLDGSVFYPDKPLCRARFAEIINRLLRRTPQSLDDLMIGMPLWTDNLDTQTWYFLIMQEASVTHTASGTDICPHWTGLG